MLYFCEACYQYNKIWGMYKDRGDPAAVDWALGDFTLDNAWHDLPLADIVPENTHAVLFRLTVRSALVEHFGRFRKKGNVNVANASTVYTQVSNVQLSNDIVVACDSNRFVQYRFDFPPGAWTLIDLVIRGWWF